MGQNSTKDLFNNGLKCLNLGNPKEALVFFEQVLKIDSNHKEALLKKGHIFGEIGKYELAVNCYDKVLELESENILSLINKGLALHFLCKYNDALSCYDMALKIKPESNITLYNKASTLIKQEKIDEGLEILSKVIDRDFSYKAKAKFDIDFKEIKKRNEFKRLVL